MDHLILGPLKSKGGDAPGLYEEAVFHHKASQSLLVTDLIQVRIDHFRASLHS